MTHISILLPKKQSINTTEEKKDESIVTSNENSKNIDNQQNKEEKNNSVLNLGPVDIKNLTLDFEDENLPIPFKTTISKLNGQASEVKNKEKSAETGEFK